MDSRYQKEARFHNKAFSEGTRKGAKTFYSITDNSKSFLYRVLESHGTHGRVLEYGCGPYTNSLPLVGKAVSVVGIDISPVAIKQYRRRTEHRNLKATAACVMNAEQLAFVDDSFDLICGVGILHHLDLAKAYRELSVVLHPEGTAIFLEPLGHNPLLNLYRSLTPTLRTADEHPLLIKDLEMARRYFGDVQARFFYLTSLLGAPFGKRRVLKPLIKLLDGLDRVIFALFPFLRKYAWVVGMVMSRPKRPPE